MIPVLVGNKVVYIKTNDPEVAKRTAERYRKEQEGDFSTLGETLVQGPVRGAIEGLVEGPIEFATSLVDLTAGTDFTSEVEKSFERIKPDKPVSTAGQVSELLFRFGAPAGVAQKMVKKAITKKATKKRLFAPKEAVYKTKPSWLKHTVAPTFAADYLATGQDVPTFGIFDEFIDEGFFNTSASREDDEKVLDEQITAGDRLRKRLVTAGTGAAMLLALPTLWKGIKIPVAGAAKGLSKLETTQNLAKFTRNKRERISEAINQGQYEAGTKWATANKVLSKLRSRGDLPTNEVSNARYSKQALLNKHQTLLDTNMRNLWGGYDWLVKSGKVGDAKLRELDSALRTALYGTNKSQKNAAMNLLKIYDNKYMNQYGTLKYVAKLRNKQTGEMIYKQVEKPRTSFVENVDTARKQIDDLTLELKEVAELSKKLGIELLSPGYLAAMEKNMGSYGYRAYKSMLKGERYLPTRVDRDAAVAELLKMKVVATADDGKALLTRLLKTGNFDNAIMAPEFAIEGIKSGILKNRKLDNLPAVRKFLGEVTGETVPDLMLKTRSTVDNLSRLVASARYMDEVAGINNRLINSGSKERFLYNSIDEVDESIRPQFLDELGDPIIIPNKPQKFGSLAGQVTTQRIRDALIGAQNGWLEQSPGVVSRVWSTFLAGKGLVQQAKTIYSPITQIRNATSASLFALMNGNVGNAQTLQDSAMIVFDALKRTNKGSLAKYYANAQRKGIVNTGAQLREIDAVIDDAARALEASEPGAWSNATQKTIKLLDASRNNFFSKVYQGSDDVWKIFSWEMEKGRMMRAFQNASKRNASFKISKGSYKNISPKNIRELEKKGGQWSALSKEVQAEVVEDISAAIVRDTVPNYAKVGSIIQSLRRSPFGNFIAFPAETVRTAVNSTSRAIDELASGVPEIAEIGMRRLMGNMAVMYAAPKATYEFGKFMTGASDEQVQAYKRSFATPWEKNADLIPIRTDKDGNIVEFYNYTYTNPYEYLRTPIAAVLNAFLNGEKRGDKLHEKLWQGLVGSQQNPGALAEYLTPFFGWSIASQGILDATRNVTYASGTARPIYNSEIDSAAIKTGKVLAHWVNLFAPPVVPVKFKPGQEGPFLKDLPRATLYSLGLTDQGLSRSGRKPDIYSQLAESFTGLKTIRPNMERTLRFRAFDAKEQMRDAASLYTQVAKNPNVQDPEAHVKALLKTNEARFEALKDVSMAVEDAKRLGMSDQEVYKVLKGTKIASPRAIMNRTFIPYFPSEFAIGEALSKEGAEQPAFFPEDALRQAWIQDIKPLLPQESFVGGPPQIPTATQPRMTRRTKAAIAPKSSAGVMLRQQELEKLLGIR